MRTRWPFEKERWLMVSSQIEGRGIHDARLLEAMRTIPRHLFVPAEKNSLAYEDFPLPIGRGQTISQPYIVALMTKLLELTGIENVLEIGTGSGYQAAILALLSGSVHTIERFSELARNAGEVLKTLELDNVSVHQGDGSEGWPDAAPYDAIIVTAAAPRAPVPLLDQLADGGRMVIPIGDRFMQDLQVWKRTGTEFIHRKNIPVAFVPLRGKYGWNEKEWS
jgi:protein-L-isoaspartate(D-aspartate) O-methyltransferase